MLNEIFWARDDKDMWSAYSLSIGPQEIAYGEYRKACNDSNTRSESGCKDADQKLAEEIDSLSTQLKDGSARLADLNVLDLKKLVALKTELPNVFGYTKATTALSGLQSKHQDLWSVLDNLGEDSTSQSFYEKIITARAELMHCQSSGMASGLDVMRVFVEDWRIPVGFGLMFGGVCTAPKVSVAIVVNVIGVLALLAGAGLFFWGVKRQSQQQSHPSHISPLCEAEADAYELVLLGK